MAGAAGLGSLFGDSEEEKARKKAAATQQLYQGAKNEFGYSQGAFDKSGQIYGMQDRSANMKNLAMNGTRDDRGLTQQLQLMAAGKGPSAAAQMLRAGNQQNAMLQQGLANSGSGQNAAGNALAAARSAGQARGSLGAQMAQARTQEQLGAIGQLGGVLANQAQSRNQLLQLEMNQALAGASNDLQREQIRQQYINQMAATAAGQQTNPSALEAGLGAFSGGLSAASGAGLFGGGGK
jgi:hypothetical protein